MHITTSDTCSLSDYPESEKQITDIADPEYLSDCSPKDKPWDRHRREADRIAMTYLNAERSGWFHRLGERVDGCAQELRFAWIESKGDRTVLELKLREARFCRVRHCPVCQWRRSLMWVARFIEAAPRVLSHYPKARFIFLVLTQRNVPITDLRSELKRMSKAWDRLVKRREFSPLLGWIRTVEVTRGKDGSAHPHYNLLLIVPEGYFRDPERFIPQETWTKLWREARKLDYDPVVHVSAVKSRCAARITGKVSNPLLGAARETLKYAVKPADLYADRTWMLKLTEQLHRCRFIASGGILKDVLRQRDEANDDLLLLSDGEGNHGRRLYFDWWRTVRRYKRRASDY